MKTYEVNLPVTGVAYVRVEAESEAEAIKRAIDICEMDDIESWNAINKVCRGNVCYAELNEASAEEVDT